MELEIGLSNGGFGVERFVASLFALTAFGSYNMGYTVRFIHPNPAKAGLRIARTRGAKFLRDFRR